MAEFITLQFMRGPEHRNHLGQAAGLVLGMQVAVGGRERLVDQLTERNGSVPDSETVDRLWK